MLETGIASNNENFQRVHAGASGFDKYKGFATFTGNAATMTLPVPFRRIKCATYDWVGTPASDEVLSLDHAADITSDGCEIQLVAQSNGGYLLNFKRTGAVKTADLAFSFSLEGLG